MTNQLVNRKKEQTHLSVERVEYREWIGGRIITLLSHFWRDDDPIELTAAIGQDWADVLDKLPKDAIDKACVEYLQAETRKPKPADIYQRATRHLQKAKPVIDPRPRQKSLLERSGVDIWNLTDEQKRDRKREADAIMAEFTNRARVPQ